MFEEFDYLDENIGAEVLPEQYPIEDKVVTAARLARMLAPVPSKRQMLAENMDRIEVALILSDRDEFNHLVSMRRFIEREWL